MTLCHLTVYDYNNGPISGLAKLDDEIIYYSRIETDNSYTLNISDGSLSESIYDELPDEIRNILYEIDTDHDFSFKTKNYSIISESRYLYIQPRIQYSLFHLSPEELKDITKHSSQHLKYPPRTFIKRVYHEELFN